MPHYSSEFFAMMLWPLTLMYAAQTGHHQEPTLLTSTRKLLIESDQQLTLELQQQKQIKKEYDFIVVGAGSAGCTLASRLSEISSWDVLLLEAGGLEEFFADIPVLAGSLQQTSMDWDFMTEPSKNFCRGYPTNQCHVPRGKVFGGTSVINYMIAVRGNRKDYDGWAEAGNPGWAYKDVFPYFKKIENITVPELKNSSYHGTKGPLAISNTKFNTVIGKAWLKAGKEQGHRVGDYNGEIQTVFSHFQYMMNTKGRRQSNSRAYIYPIINKRDKLQIHVNAYVTKLIIEENKVKGVVAEIKGQTYEIFARKEVILSAGAINSPQILMLSGIGPKDHLESFKIPVYKDLPVGLNLQDHYSFGGFAFLTNLADKDLIGSSIANNPQNLVDYVERGYGPFAIPGGNAGVFYYDPKSPNDPKGLPEVEIVISTASPISEEDIRGYRPEIVEKVLKPLTGMVTYRMQSIILHPKSRGSIQLRSTNPHDHVKLFMNYFDHPDDEDIILKGIRKVLDINRSPAFRRFNAHPLRVNIPGCNQTWGSDEYWKCVMRLTTSSKYHQCCTCEMGPKGVVDERLRVRGVASLRVVDASIMPTVPSAHTNIPTTMIAEKAADIIKEDYKEQY